MVVSIRSAMVKHSHWWGLLLIMRWVGSWLLTYIVSVLHQVERRFHNRNWTPTTPSRNKHLSTFTPQFRVISQTTTLTITRDVNATCNMICNPPSNLPTLFKVSHFSAPTMPHWWGCKKPPIILHTNPWAIFQLPPSPSIYEHPCKTSNVQPIQIQRWMVTRIAMRFVQTSLSNAIHMEHMDVFNMLTRMFWDCVASCVGLYF